MKYRVYLMPGHRESDPTTAAVDQLIGKQATVDVECDGMELTKSFIRFYVYKSNVGYAKMIVPHHAYWLCEQVSALDAVENVAVPTECVHHVPVGAFCQDCLDSFNKPFDRALAKMSGSSDVD